jgi:hypothetical protein
MKNPFQYGSVVRGDAFCNRKQELADLLRAMENGDRLFVYSERRLGKTSVVRVALEKLPKKQYLGVYVDLWPTDSEGAFAVALARAVAEAVGPTPKKMLEAARTFFAHLAPSVTIDDEGKPKVTFGLARPGAAKIDLGAVLEAPAKIAAQGKRKVAVVLDECQRMLEYGNDAVERRLRSVIQHQGDVSWIFLGSRKHLIQSMFLDQSRPLYRAAGHYPLEPIDEKHWIPFVRKRFLDARKGIDDEQIRTICALTEGHPFYTQHICHALWESCEPRKTVTQEMIDVALGVLLDRESYAYTTLWESLALNQRRFLMGLAREPRGVKPFSADFTQRYGLRSASNAQRAVEALLQRDVIDHDNGSFVITDRFFKIWIRQRQE